MVGGRGRGRGEGVNVPPVLRCRCGFYLQTRRKAAANIYCRRHLAAALCWGPGGWGVRAWVGGDGQALAVKLAITDT